MAKGQKRVMLLFGELFWAQMLEDLLLQTLLSQNKRGCFFGPGKQLPEPPSTKTPTLGGNISVFNSHTRAESNADWQFPGGPSLLSMTISPGWGANQVEITSIGCCISQPSRAEGVKTDGWMASGGNWTAALGASWGYSSTSILPISVCRYRKAMWIGLAPTASQAGRMPNTHSEIQGPNFQAAIAGWQCPPYHGQQPHLLKRKRAREAKMERTAWPSPPGQGGSARRGPAAPAAARRPGGPP